MRAALALSVLGLAGSGAALAADGCAAPTRAPGATFHCQPATQAAVPAAVHDLTVVAVEGDVVVENHDPVYRAGYGNQIGLYANAGDGDATVDNSGDIGVYALGGVADGIFAAGAHVDVDNSGDIVAVGNGWSAGIEAQGEDLTTVANSGNIYAYGFYGFGLYAAGGDIEVTNDGTLEAQGYIATGLSTQASGDTTIGNSGDITAGTLYEYNGGLYGSLLATGIHAGSSGIGASTTVDNSGDINVTGYQGAIGIEVVATGEGGSGSVANSGNIYANQYSKYGYGAAGIVVSADGDASIDNSGSITAVSGGLAYGAMALSFNGDAMVTNSGDITVASTGSLQSYAAYGLLASSQNGAAFVDNSGDVSVASDYLGVGYIGMGIRAAGLDGATVTNTGSVSVDAKYAYGIYASSGAGDVTVGNGSDGVIDVYSYAGIGFGVLALGTQGDVDVANEGLVDVYAYGQSVGVFARSAEGNVGASNDGSISAASGSGTAVGVFARTEGGSIGVANTGSIEAYSAGNQAFGVLGSGEYAEVVNSGTIDATGYAFASGINVYGDVAASVDNAGAIGAYGVMAANGIYAGGGDSVEIHNSGDIVAVAYGLATGIYGYSTYGDVSIGNTGYIGALSLYDVADGIFASGATVSVDNGGDIVALGGYWGAGIEAQGDGTSVTNTGSIYAYGGVYGFGIYATGGDDGLSIANEGSIEAQGYIASGIYAQGGGSIDITNGGDITAGMLYEQDGYLYGSLMATGIHAGSGSTDAFIGVDNSGDISAVGYLAATGIEVIAVGEGASAHVGNSGSIYASQYSKYGYGAAGIVVSTDGDARIDNAGGILATSAGTAYGALALAFNGDATVTNAGDIAVASTGSLQYYGAFGIVAASQNGSAFVDNSGSIDVSSDYLDVGYIGMGIQATGLDGVTVTNTGDISVDAKYAYGIYASSGAGDIAVSNAGLIDVYSYFSNGFGVLALATQGDVFVDNSGEMDVYAYGQAVGAFTSSSEGDASVANGGVLSVTSGGGVAAGAFARAGNGVAMIENTGTIRVDGYGTAYGALARGLYAGVANAGDIEASGQFAFGAYVDGLYGAAIANDGDILAEGGTQAIGAMAYAYLGDALVYNAGGILASTDAGTAIGAYVSGYGSAAVYNSGDIHAAAGADGNAIGLFATSYGDVTIDNSGTISASHPDVAIAVVMNSVNGDATLVNSGVLRTDTATAGSVAVLGGNEADRIYNSGDIYGAIVTAGGEDLVANQAGGIWHVGNFTSDLGAGDDAITNAAGGVIHLANGGVFLGAADTTNSFDNAGVLMVSGYGLVHMGTDDSVLSNDGAISFLDGGANDLLVVAGDLGGTGSINVDADLDAGVADMLYVYGDVVADSQQTINLLIDGVPAALSSDADVVVISGDASADNFAGGEVLGFYPSNFLDLDVSVAMRQEDGFHVVSASVDVVGLNDTGVLAASVAPGVHDLIGASVGTWKQRMGVQPALDEGRVGLGPWLRFYGSDGDVSPEASGFSASRDFGFEQDNRGREFGFNLAVGGGFNIGVLAGTADARQVLTGASGSDRIDLDYSGLYGTWVAPAFYLDASMRWMDFDAVLTSAGGEQRTNGNASAFNVEAGYTGWNLGGLSLTPQVQYTRAKIDDIAPISGSLVDFEADGGVSERLRLGLGASRDFTSAGGVRWTPYGAISAVDEMAGESRYMVAGNALFSGASSTDGTHALVEAGVGVQFGGWSFTGGLNWADGGAIDSATGGQVVLRYTW